MKSAWLRAPQAYVLLAVIVLAFRLATALPLERAGYMDASYTIHVAQNIVAGRGLTEQILWNYLDAPTGLPHPSNLYWLPLPSLLAAASYLVLGVSYRAAQVPFILLSVVPPLFAYYLARRVSGRDDYGWLAGLLTAFSGFYTIRWVSPDNFTPFTVTADLSLLCAGLALADRTPRKRYLLAAGALAGLSQLSRADGFLLLAAVPIALCLTSRSWRAAWIGSVWAGVAFLLVVAPWLLRNIAVVGSPLAPGGAYTLFLTEYDEFFSYHASELTFMRYLAWGAGNILASKFEALAFGLGVVWLGALQVFAAPFAIAGLASLRRRAEFVPFLVYAPLLVLAMALVFTFPGMHGSMLHSSAALVPFFAAAIPPGLDRCLRWAARRRKWNLRGAQLFFRGGMVALALGFSLYVYAPAVWSFGSPPSSPLWNDIDAEYKAVDAVLVARGVPPAQPVMTVDPPSFYAETGRSSILSPTDDVEALFQAAGRFGAHYLVLQYDHPRTLAELYDGKAEVSGLRAIARLQDAAGRPVMLYEIEAR